eukprot:TRINITY_DN25293_c0_g1_i2.p1 TRINITY_DN25293_c0_g1~~TRINITY_DN25293_c0_g1_i2.p1  ORF type:complete len:609 (+),score=100.36 TRINITY_DN25293_c0_g1_i2:174-2000(+)
MFLFVFLCLAQPTQSGGSPTCTDLGCVELCENATEPDGAVENCVGIGCNTAYGQCECAGDRLLHSNFSCSGEDVVVQSDCQASHQAFFNFAAYPSPDIMPDDVRTGMVSATLLNLIQHGADAATGQGAGGVNISEAVVSAQYVGNTTNDIMLFDLGFVFCAEPRLGEIGGGAFEHSFKLELQKYMAIGNVPRTGVLSLLNLTELQDDANASAGSGDLDAVVPRQRLETKDFPIIIALGIITTCAIFGIALVSPFACRMAYRHLRSRAAVAVAPADVEDVELGEEEEEDGVEKRVVAQVCAAFAPDDVEDDKMFREACLQLNEGDVVEVIAGGGGWFYGRLLDKPECCGFFPENRAAWIGAIPQTRVAASSEQHMLVAVDHSFAPGDLEAANWVCEKCGESNKASRAQCNNCGADCPAQSLREAANADAEDEKKNASLLRENCLQVEAGEVVQVLAGGGGWLYGQVVGSPDRIGYIPENRAKWLGECDEPDEATQTQDGALMQVAVAFSPGAPGDSQEEVDFHESCIALAEGDVVEVVASGGGWLYGRVVGAPERVGYFPESRVSYVGQPVAMGAGREACPASTAVIASCSVPVQDAGVSEIKSVSEVE